MRIEIGQGNEDRRPATARVKLAVTLEDPVDANINF
jgi:hypothetical protein